MNCIEFEAHIDQFVDDSLSETDQHKMVAHKDQCATCAHSVRQHRLYHNRLSAWQEPQLTTQQKNRLLSQLDTHSVKPAQNHFKVFAGGFATASIFAMALFIGGQFLQPTPNKTQTNWVALLEDDIQLSREITIVINSPTDILQAQLQLALPSELSVIGQENLANVNMPISLKKGKNTIIIPIQFEEFARYADSIVVDASLIYKNSKKDFALDLNEYIDSDSPQIQSDELIKNNPTVTINKNV